MRLRNPRSCPKCCKQRSSRVIDSRARKGGYRRRLHLCECGETWATFESLVDPKAIIRALPEWAREQYTE
jgi:transcriptional regulator NrdR family protein